MKSILSRCKSSMKNPRSRLAIGLSLCLACIYLALVYTAIRFDNDALLTFVMAVMPTLMILPILLGWRNCKASSFSNDQ